MEKLNVLDLFSGCGGLSKGFEDAGYNVILGVDNDETALATFERNHKNSKKLLGNLADSLTFDIIEKTIESKPVHVIVGGPPCQGFSLTGPRNFDDERNRLYQAMIESVKRFSPLAFVIENVPGMATLYKGKIKEEVMNRFSEMGYTVNSRILLAADYGVPQMRKRLFFVGLKNSSEEFNFPEPTHSVDNYISCEDAIGDLPSRKDGLGKEADKYTERPVSEYQKKMRRKTDVLYNHIATDHKQHVKEVIAQVPEGGNHKDLPEGVGTSRRFNEAWTRYHSKKPSKTIDTGHRNHFHYHYNRVPTIRENARLQSFPDDFIFYGNKTQQNRQVGNAVPPLLGQAIAKQLKKYIKQV